MLCSLHPSATLKVGETIFPPYLTRGHLTMAIPPGISFLLTTIFQASPLPLTLGILDYFVLRPYGVHNLPESATIATCLVSPLVAFSVRLLLGDLNDYISAKRAGGVLPPHDPTWVPGAIHRVIRTFTGKGMDAVYLCNFLADSHCNCTDILPRYLFRRYDQEPWTYL